MGRKFYSTQVGYSTPFDNATNGFVAEDVQAAIEEVDNKIQTFEGKPRAIVAMGYGGTANSGRWLETFDSVSSNTVPFHAPENCTIKALSLSNANVSSGAVTLYKNGVAVQTISLTSETFNTIAGLDISITTGDDLSAQVTTSGFSQPVLYISLRVDL